MVLFEHLSVMPLVINSQRKENKTAPECLTRLQSMEVDRGCTVNLTVIIAGFPAPQITWTLDDDIISETNERFIFEHDATQNRYTLIITHITRQQEGVYRCIAKNCQGSCATMGFITVKEIIRRRRRNVSRKPKIATISEWKSQEEKEHDPDGDTFVIRNKHCWDWWNLEALSDNEEVFDRIESPINSPNKIKPPNKKNKEIISLTPYRSGAIPVRQRKASDDSKVLTQREKVVHQRKPFIRAKSAEPESNLTRRKSTSMPEIHNGLVANKYKKLRNFWEQISAKK